MLSKALIQFSVDSQSCVPSLLFTWGQAMATHSSTLAWKIPWTEEPGGCSPWGRQESDTTEQHLPVNVQESLAEAWDGGGLLQDQRH